MKLRALRSGDSSRSSPSDIIYAAGEGIVTWGFSHSTYLQQPWKERVLVVYNIAMAKKMEILSRHLIPVTSAIQALTPPSKRRRKQDRMEPMRQAICHHQPTHKQARIQWEVTILLTPRVNSIFQYVPNSSPFSMK